LVHDAEYIIQQIGEFDAYMHLSAFERQTDLAAPLERSRMLPAAVLHQILPPPSLDLVMSVLKQSYRLGDDWNHTLSDMWEAFRYTNVEFARDMMDEDRCGSAILYSLTKRFLKQNNVDRATACIYTMQNPRTTRGGKHQQTLWDWYQAWKSDPRAGQVKELPRNLVLMLTVHQPSSGHDDVDTSGD
jgi:hypothetical protein